MLNRQYSIVKAACKQSATPLLGFTSHSPGVAYELRHVDSIRTQIRFLYLLHARWVSPTSYAMSTPSVRKSASCICSTLAGCRLRATLCRLHPLAIRICSLRSLHPYANPLHLHFFFKSKQ